MNNWARVLQAKGDYGQAEDYYNRVLAIMDRANAASTWPPAQVVSNRGLLHFDRGEYAAAGQDARRAMEIRRKLGGDSTPAFANSLIEVAEDLAFGGDPGGAVPLLRSALEIQKLWQRHRPSSRPKFVWARRWSRRVTAPKRKRCFGRRSPPPARSLSRCPPGRSRKRITRTENV